MIYTMITQIILISKFIFTLELSYVHVITFKKKIKMNDLLLRAKNIINLYRFGNSLANFKLTLILLLKIIKLLSKDMTLL